MSQLPRNSERQLTIHDVLRPLRRSILATDWLARVETARDQAEEALRTEFDEISRAHVGYKLPPKALRGKLGRMVREYQNLSLHSLYTNHQIGHYVERLERGLESRLTSPSQPPILHAKHIETNSCKSV